MAHCSSKALNLSSAHLPRIGTLHIYLHVCLTLNGPMGFLGFFIVNSFSKHELERNMQSLDCSLSSVPFLSFHPDCLLQSLNDFLVQEMGGSFISHSDQVYTLEE